MATSVRDQFRPDIQGLRALAVSLVIVYHLHPTRLTGGFVGVDVFFVISGYLITAHLMAEIVSTGTIQVRRFWARRIRRLLPAALVVLAASMLATIVWLPQTVWIATSQQVAASAAYVVNWVLAAQSVSYLAAGDDPSLVQHYWSLSVEEQLYAVWPLVLILAVTLLARTRKGSTNERRRRTIGVAIGTIGAASLAFSVIYTSVSPAAAYFITPTRVWEFAAGAAVAFLPTVTSTAIRGAGSWLGLALVVGAAVGLDGAGFPGFIAMVPVAGTALLIWLGKDAPRWAPATILSFKPAQIIGDLSYGIYLWHWPIIVVYPFVVGHRPGILGMIGIVAATVALAVVTKYTIEDPVRRGAYWSSGLRRSFTLAAGGMAIVIALAAVTWGSTEARFSQPPITAPFNSQDQLQQRISEVLDRDAWPEPDQLPGRDAQAPEWVVDNCITAEESDLDRCRYGTGSEGVAVVLGDSYATAYLPAIRRALPDWQIQVATRGQCPTADVAVHVVGETAEYQACPAHRMWTNDYIARTQPDLVIVANSSVSTLKRLMSGSTGAEALSEFTQGLDSAFAELALLGVPTVVLGDPPRTNCRAEEKPIDCEPRDELAEDPALALIRERAEAHGIGYIDTRWWFCSETTRLCPQIIDGSLVRADNSHLTGAFSARLSGVLASRLRNAYPDLFAG